MLPGLPQFVAAAIGGLALALGLVALLNGAFLGGAIALSGLALIGWSITRKR